MIDKLKSEAKSLNNSLSRFLISGPRSFNEFSIDCSILCERFLKEDIRKSSEFGEVFEKLTDIERSPCLYVFEIDCDTPADLVISKLTDFASRSEKVIPKIKSGSVLDSRTLYVGKVNNFVWGRLITHLGFHTHKADEGRRPSNNHGLQLYFWAKQIQLKLKFTVIEFEPEQVDALTILEKKLAIHLKPLIGIHK